MNPWVAESMDSPLGPLHLRIDAQDRLVALAFDDGLDALRAHDARHGPIETRPTGAIVQRLRAYFEGDLDAIDAIEVAAAGTAFQSACWQTLRRIPAGRPWSYLEEARALGRPSATRAVGRANGANPIPIVVPCHRVIAHDGTLGGYSAGLARKIWLLDHERRHAPARVDPMPTLQRAIFTEHASDTASRAGACA